ncbi:MAG: hypothetical protein M3R30_06740 [Candidatus Eremiobacteraeota bacterium]|nr:hypothetical protein [Candidatus Eremiobacteraeota bacterium]
MNRFYSAALGIAFAAATLLAPVSARADDGHGDSHGQHGDAQGQHACQNPAGNTRGWCKHSRDRDDKDKKNFKPHGNTRGDSTVSGTVVSISGTTAVVRLDNGGYVNVRENGTTLTVGQHYNLNGCYRNNVFVLGCYSNGTYPGGQNQQVGGTILSVSGDRVTLLGLPPVTIDASQAINNNRTNGSLAIGRHITAHGYYQNGTFFATSIQ